MSIPKASLFNLTFHIPRIDSLMGEIEKHIRDQQNAWASTTNPEIVVSAQKDVRLRETIANADYVLPDGVALLWAGKILGVPIPERITGIDLGEKLLHLASRKGYSVFFLGASPGVAEKAAKMWKEKYPSLQIAGTHHGHFQAKDEVRVVQTVVTAKPDILFVGLGYPKQEEFLSRNVSKMGVPFSLTVGGAFDVWSGNLRRAPDIFIRLGVEWIFRLLQQPRRIRRQFKLIQFIFLVLRKKFSL